MTTVAQLVRKLRAVERAAHEAAAAVEEANRLSIAEGLSISDLGLSVRSRKTISAAGASTVVDLIGLSAADLMAVRVGGVMSLNEIRESLSEKQLCLRGEEP